MARDNSGIESERRYLAERLEQDVISTLALLQAQTQTYLSALQGNPPAATALTIISTLVNQSLQKARYLQESLNPAILETLGLTAALESLAIQEYHVRGLRITVTVRGQTERLPSDIEFSLYRAIQYLINMAVDPARASLFTVSITWTKNSIVVSYRDNGLWQFSGESVQNAIVEQLQTIHSGLEITVQSDDELEISLNYNQKDGVSLTNREQEIMQLVAEGLANKEIAARLHISARTVNFHLDNVYTKLEVNTRTEAVMACLQQGWIQNPAK